MTTEDGLKTDASTAGSTMLELGVCQQMHPPGGSALWLHDVKTDEGQEGKGERNVGWRGDEKKRLSS